MYVPDLWLGPRFISRLGTFFFWIRKISFSGVGWWTKLKSYCLLQHVVINVTLIWILTHFGTKACIEIPKFLNGIKLPHSFSSFISLLSSANQNLSRFNLGALIFEFLVLWFRRLDPAFLFCIKLYLINFTSFLICLILSCLELTIN